MFLSRIPLDVCKRNTLKALSSPSIFHGALESSFAGKRKRNLWRIDILGGQYYILVMSEDEPDFSSFYEQFGDEEKPCETKSYDSLLDRIKAGDKWRFRLTANPTYSVYDSDKDKRGKIKAHVTADFQRKWLMDRADKYGFSVTENSFDIIYNKWFRFYKKGSQYLSMLSVTYEGILEVTDAERFRNALVNGIGKEKAYGMGMLTVMRV